MKKLIIAAIGSSLLTACATSQPPASVEDLQQKMQALNNEAQVKEYAPVELSQAQEKVNQVSQTWEDEGTGDALSHNLYMAHRDIDNTRLTAEKRKLQEQIDNAKEDRTKMLLSIRKQEAEAAKQRASSTEQKLSSLQNKLQDVQAKATDRGIVLTLDGVLFEFDKAKLNPGGERTVNRLAEFLQKHPGTKVAVEGHTDALGEKSYNLELSERRAQSVLSALEQQGISRDRVEIRAYGEQYPVASNDTQAGRQQNRRVEVVLSKTNEDIKERQ